MDKKTLRALMRERSGALTDRYRAGASAVIAERVLALDAFREAETVFCYLSLPTEPDTAAIVRAALAAGKTVLVPRCEGHGVMHAVRYDASTATEPGAYGIAEPAEGAPYEGAIDLAIVPCVSASPDGRRLGHGAGYYDRFLALRPARTVCLCFGALLREDIPTEPYDLRMERVVSEL